MEQTWELHLSIETSVFGVHMLIVVCIQFAELYDYLLNMKVQPMAPIHLKELDDAPCVATGTE